MDFFTSLKEKAADLAQVGVAKSKQAAEIGKLKVNNAGEEAVIKKAYAEIGRLYYKEHGMAPEEAYAALCEKITAAKINIEENDARIAELKDDGVDAGEVVIEDLDENSSEDHITQKAEDIVEDLKDAAEDLMEDSPKE